jgi:hypothetical protein
MHLLLESMILVNLREAKNKGKFLSGSTPTLCNQPTADKLLPGLKKHSLGLVLSYRIACQIEMINARNFKKMF